MRKTAGIWAAASLLALTATGLALPTQAQNVSDLAGYSTLSVSPEFEKFLTENPNVKRRLQKNDDLSQALLADNSLQTALMSGEKTFFELQKELESMPSAQTNTRVPSSAQQKAQKSLQRAQQSLSSDGFGDAQALQTILNAQKALMEEQTARQGELESALEEVADLQDTLEDIRQENPEAVQRLFADTDLLQRVLHNEMTLSEAMEELGIEHGEDIDNATSSNASASPTPSPSPQASAEGLRQVSGNKYRMGEETLWDINHIPEAGETALDANGWPKYLNVPEGCPAPRENIDYFHSARHGGAGEHRSDMDIHSSTSYTYFGGNWKYISLTDREAIAIPFTTKALTGLYGKISLGGGNSTEDGANLLSFEISISHCPDDFDLITPTGAESINKKDPFPRVGGFTCSPEEDPISSGWGREHLNVEILDVGEKPHNKRSCVLSPHTRYFINVKPKDLSSFEEAQSLNPTDNLPDINIDKKQIRSELRAGVESGAITARSHKRADRPERNGHELRVSLLTGRGRLASEGALYANACVKDSAPKPLNYSSRLTPDSAPRCGYRTENVTCTPHSASGFTCYDPYNTLPPRKLTQTCVPEGNALVWSNGYGEPLFSRYRCEADTVDIKGYTENRAEKHVCAAHRAGELRNRISPGKYSNRSIYSVEQCQFDETRERFDWVTVDVQVRNAAPPSSRSRNNAIYNSRHLPPPSLDAPTKCAFLGRTYDVGEKVNVSCLDSGIDLTHTLTCDQRSSKEMAPVLVNGDGLNLDQIQLYSLYTSAGTIAERADLCDIKEL